jgi:hypothetical protein
MIVIKETVGDTVIGALDGTNATFKLSFPFASGTVNVFHNGLLLNPSFDDGFSESAPQTIIMNEAPQVGDSVIIEYHSNVKSGGGALGGIPRPPQVVDLRPAILGTVKVDCCDDK